MPMNVKDYVCGSCAGGEIISLSTHKNAEDAMNYFCEKVLGLPNGPAQGFYRSASQPRYNCTASHYVFISGPEANEDGEGYANRTWPNYGSDFAEYIIDNKLGKVATLPKTKNRKYHPTTSCQIWVWQPDQVALEKLWDTKNKALIEKLNKEHEERKKLLANLANLKVPVIKLQHQNARPTRLGPLGQWDGIQAGGWIGSYVTFDSASGRSLYNFTFDGTKHYTSMADTKTEMPKLKVEYVILTHDSGYWTVAEREAVEKVGEK